MKRKITSVVLALVIVCSLFSMTACGNKNNQENIPQNATMTLVVGVENPVAYEVGLSEVETGKGLMPILEYLKTEKGLDYKSDDSGYGAFLTKIGALEQSGSTYIYLYTSVEKDADVSQYATTIDYNGKTLCSSGVGASEMTIEDGCVIYVGTIEY